ncbi:restriction endonuclease subunit S [Enterococcus faecium]|uniref:restriction endonuclease subunit S n=1 Tax=Enterococcus faecium TaxID=1352 RepID=UPI0018843CB4|nr:restriction endonuclease subunit S [Enterococcus faecium]EME7126682.1 restriction endonuclease subunit S [Enterococcus faecium]MBE9883412.1 restriction endonuclease subunit S [Enterococcus faecium]
MSNNAQPEIRFPGFTEGWEQHKLIEVARYRNGKAHEQAIDESGKYIVVNSKFVSTNGRVKKYTNIIIDPLKKNELAFVLSDVPNGKAIARTFLVDKEHRYSLNQRIAGITPHKDTDSYFLNVLMNRNPYFLKFDNGVGQTNLTKADVENFIGHYPSYEEQQKIGTFFKQLDDTIALHQRKLDLLKETKKGFLQKMFPKNGAKVPEIRFPGFTGDWEERKVGEIFKVTRGQVLAATETSESITEKNIYPVYSSQTKNDGLMGYYSDYLFDTAITWTTDGANAGTVNYRNGKFYSTNVNGVLLSDKGYANKAVAEIINRIAWKHVSKVGNPKLMNNVMSEITITIPSVEEQETISRFFTQLDSTITLHERELDLLKETKKGFLQKMFV